jgi:pimeloyl-ACP methyl ester carboxylesterase
MTKAQLFVITGCFIYIVAGCDTTDSFTDEPSEYLVSDDFSRTITAGQIESFWTLLGQPEASDFTLYGVDTYRIVYNTIDFEGRPVEASGAILVPKDAENPGILSVQHSTIFSNDEAPSVDRSPSIFEPSVTTRKAIFASAGYIVFLPDYLGFGITRNYTHTYQHRQTLASASHDMVRAGMEFIEKKGFTEVNQPLHMAGYSEGAYATLALAEAIETSNSGPEPGLVSMGGGIFDLTATVDYTFQNIDQPTNCPACYAHFLFSYHEMYQFSRPLSDYFRPPYDQVIADGLFSGEFTSSHVRNQFTGNLRDLLQENFVERHLNGQEPEFEAALAENDLFYIPAAPTLLVHGEDDIIAPVFNSNDFNERAAAAGKSNLTYLRAEGVNHAGGITLWGMETLKKLRENANSFAVKQVL